MGLLLESDAPRPKERWSNLPEDYHSIFYDIMHEVVDCYVDDLVVKTRRRTDHLADLKQVFERLRVHL